MNKQILDEIPRDFLHLSTEKDLNFTLYQIRTFTQAGLNVKAIHCAERYLDFIYSKDREISRFNQLDCDLFKEYLFLLHKTCSNKIESLSLEARQKLSQIRPATLGQASRISGINPSDISVLMVYIGR